MRRPFIALAVMVLTLAAAAPALAGGWAVTTLDTLPTEIRAAQSYSIGYTIRQHGVTPINVESMGGTTAITITSPDGAKTFTYQAVQEGATGHYVAKLTFPTEGAWTWQVSQGPFEAQSLGKIQIAPVAGAVSAPAQQATAAQPAPAPVPTTNPLLLVALLLAFAGAAILFGVRAADLVRGRTTA